VHVSKKSYTFEINICQMIEKVGNYFKLRKIIEGDTE